MEFLLELVYIDYVKGTVSQDFLLRIFCQSAHSGPIRDALGPFLSFLLFIELLHF